MSLALADYKLHVFSRSQLNLSENQLGPEGAKALAPALVRSSLTKILVGLNSLGDEGTTILSVTLRESTVSKVEELNLQYNEISPNGAKAIAALCAVRTSLTHCDVRLNNIVGEGASQLSAVVLANTNIEVFNEIPIKEMRADSFTTLDLSGKNIGVEGGMVVAGLVPAMGSLTKLNAGWNNMSKEGEAQAALRKAVEGRAGFELKL